MQVLVFLIVPVLMVLFLNQVRKPTRWIGRPFLWVMNRSHSRVTDWGLQHVVIQKHFTILDVGCGGGRTIQKLAALATEGIIYGVDYSGESVAASRAKNLLLIKAGHVDIRQASVSQLPFPGDQFDLVTAVETQYYWLDLVNDMQEILRVLKPGERLLIVAESYNRGQSGARQWLGKRVLKFTQLNVAEQRELFSAAGYTDVQMFEEQKEGWMCGTGRKPL